MILVTSDTNHRTRWNHSALITTATNQNLLQRTNLNTKTIKIIILRKKIYISLGLHHSDSHIQQAADDPTKTYFLGTESCIPTSYLTSAGFKIRAVKGHSHTPESHVWYEKAPVKSQYSYKLRF